MRAKPIVLALLCLTASLATGCLGDLPAPVDSGLQLASRCQPGEEWLADSPAFTNQTESWGLTALAVRGSSTRRVSPPANSDAKFKTS